MAGDDSRPRVMTEQLQWALELLAKPAAQLEADVADYLAKHPGSLVPLAPDEVDPNLAAIAELAEELTPWEPLDLPPLPPIGTIIDVWVFGNPPRARANGRAFPRYVAAEGNRQAVWFTRTLLQRARTYEKVVAAAVAQRPELAIAEDPATVTPVAIRELAEAIGIHESTITRVAQGCRFQNLHGPIRFAPVSAKTHALGFASS